MVLENAAEEQTDEISPWEKPRKSRNKVLGQSAI